MKSSVVQLQAPTSVKKINQISSDNFVDIIVIYLDSLHVFNIYIIYFDVLESDF